MRFSTARDQIASQRTPVVEDNVAAAHVPGNSEGAAAVCGRVVDERGRVERGVNACARASKRACLNIDLGWNIDFGCEGNERLPEN